MDDATSLNAKVATIDVAHDSECPRCGQAPSAVPSVATSLGPFLLRRCSRCGTRYNSEDPARLVFTCDDCGLPFLADELLPHSHYRCPDCALGRAPADLPAPEVARAVEREIRMAVDRSWTFAGEPGLIAYLDRLSARLAYRMEGAPPAPRVALFEDAAIRTLALPSGLLLVSLGALMTVEDEAELAFVLGHELGHAACGDAAVRLVRLGLHAVAADARAHGEEAWSRAAHDLVSLGYGRRRERDADARSLSAMLALDYDAAAALRWLGRLQARIDRGDSRVADAALAHPVPRDRGGRIERALFGRALPQLAARVNREVFRRAAGHGVLTTRLTRLPGLEAAIGDDAEPLGAHPDRRARWPWLVVAAAGVAAAAAALFLFVR
jgi:hypothetical protein